MLQTIRDRVSGLWTKVMLGMLVAMFVSWGIELRSIGSSGSTSAVEVNGDPVSLTVVNNAWKQRQTDLQKELQGDLSDARKKQEQDDLLNQYIRSELIQQRTRKLGFRASDQDVVGAIRSLESLQVDGQFSRERYATALLQRGMNEAQFESDLRTELQARQLQNGVTGTAFMTAKELSRAQALLDEKREIDYVQVPAKAYISSIKASDSDLAAWFEAHKTEYLSPETVDLQYVELKLADSAAEVKVDDAALRTHYEQIKDRYTVAERRHGRHILIAISKEVDDASAKKQADDLDVKLKGGADFEALARQYSKDTGSASKGGDLGWAGRGQFVKPFEDSLFSLKPGELSAPVKSEFGYHIIRLDEVDGGTTKPFDQVRSEVETDYKNDRARSLFYDKTQKLADAAFAKLTELDSVAKDFGATVKSVSGFTRQGGGEFGKDSQVIEAAFSESVLEKGENSPLVTLGEDRALVLRVTDHKLPAQKSLESVRGEVLARFSEHAAKEAAVKQGQMAVEQLQSGASQWPAVNKLLPAVPAGKKLLGRSADGVDSLVLKSAFSVPKSEISAEKPAYRGLVLSNGDFAVVKVSAVQSGVSDSDLAAKARLSELRGQRTEKVGAAEFSSYIQELQRTAKIERNPTVFQ